MAFLSKINDVSGGDITSIVSSTGLSGGATSGVVTLSVDAAQTGITSLGTQTANFSVENGYGIIIGTTGVQETVSIGDGATDLVPELQVLGTAAADASMLLAAFSTTATTAGSPIIALAKGGHGTLGSHTIVTDGEELGNIIAFGDDGNDLETPAASIQFEVDGTPGANDMPGRILFNTTADGATALSERLRIDSAGLSTFAGNVQLGGGDVDTANSYSALVIEKDDHSRLEFLNPVDKVGTIWFSDTTEGMGRIEYSHSNNQFDIRTNATYALTIDSSQDVGIGISTPDSRLHVWDATAGSVAAVANTVLTLENSTHAYLSILTPNDTVGGIVFGDVGSNVAGRLLYTHDPASPQGFQFYVETALAASLNATGLVLADASTVNISTPLLAGADHTATGLTAQMLAGGAISAFDLVCIHTVTQEVVEADARALATTRVIGIAPAAISDTATGTILLHGFIRDDSWNWTTGATLYLSETAGAMTETAPTTSGAFVKVVGIALEPDVVYINPDNSWIEIA